MRWRPNFSLAFLSMFSMPCALDSGEFLEMLVWAETARMSSWMVLKKRAWSLGWLIMIWLSRRRMMAVSWLMPSSFPASANLLLPPWLILDV